MGELVVKSRAVHVTDGAWYGQLDDVGSTKAVLQGHPRPSEW
jgi:hypothetical protein